MEAPSSISVTSEDGTWPRLLSGLLGAWVVISAFVWPHSPAQMLNTVICGVLTMAFALVAVERPQLRFLGTAVGAWLLFNAFALGSSVLVTAWNDVFAGIAIIAATVVPSSPRELAPLRHPLHELHRRRVAAA